MNILKRLKDKNKLKKVFPVILLLFLITIIIGVTYAAYLVTLQSGENSITTGLVSMSYTESTNVISIENALPISDVEGKASSNYFDFSVTSNLTLNENDNYIVTYFIDIEPLSTNTLNDNQIKVYLENTSTDKALVDSKLISELDNYILYSTSHEHKYNVNTVTTNYRLRAWIDYNTDVSDWDSSTQYEYKFRVNINTEKSQTLLSYSKGTLNYAMQNQVQRTAINYKYINDANVTEYTMNENPTTEQINSCVTALADSDLGLTDYKIQTLCTGGSAGGIAWYDISLADALTKGYLDYDIIADTGIVSKGDTVYNVNDNGVFLYNGTDDNGGDYPIYYYRGNVTNNNVLFANMCWKIVRTTSTGGTKLIYNGLPIYSYENLERIDESSYVVTANTPSTYPFTFDSSTKEWSSGIAGQASTTNTIEFTVSEAGDYVLNYTVGSEGYYDKASFYKNGVALASDISGVNKTGSLDLLGLSTTDVIKVTYTKNGSGDQNGDTVTFSIDKSTGEKTFSCNNTGNASVLASNDFNSDINSYSSPAYIGYMYGEKYFTSSINMNPSDWYSFAGYSSEYKSITSTKYSMSSTSYYYGDSVTYENGTYTLNNAETHTWSSDYSNLKGYYTFFSSSSSSTSKPYYIVSSDSYSADYTTYGSEKLGIGKNVTYSDGRYTITDYSLLDKKDYYSNYSSYEGYYICSDNSNSCSSIRYIDDTWRNNYYYVTLSNGKTYASIIEDFEANPWIYGNDVEYSNGTYTLKNTTTSSRINWSNDYKTLANGYHYTCFNTTGTCSSVYYMTSFGYGEVDYLTFTGGDNLDIAKEKMFSNDNDSTIKTEIDDWYSGNLTMYTKYLENTIFCNDRSSASDEIYTVDRGGGSHTENGGALSSKDTNAENGTSYFKSYENTGKGTPSLQCANKNDRFSLRTENGGTEGYGNNALKYPVALLTANEAVLAGGQYITNYNYYLYLKNDGYEYYEFWLLSPSYWHPNGVEVVSVETTGALYHKVGTPGPRPVVSLKHGTTFSSGTGEPNSPYVVKTN